MSTHELLQDGKLVRAGVMFTSMDEATFLGKGAPPRPRLASPTNAVDRERPIDAAHEGPGAEG